MAEYLEIPLNGWIGSFDGRVFEVYTPYQDGSARYHVMLMVDFHIDGNTLTANFQRNDIGLWPFLEQDRPLVEQLVAAVRAVRGQP
jgi:hypothetical protein